MFARTRATDPRRLPIYLPMNYGYTTLGKYQHRRQALLDLADSANDPFLRMAPGTARSCHTNFYNDWMEQEELEGYLPDIQAFVNQLLEARADPAEG